MLLTSGCALFPPAKAAGPATDRYVVIASRTPFYRYGPSQPTPDFSLSAGQPLTLLRREFGFSQVRTDAGKVGYVSTDDIGPAPPAAPDLPPLKSRGRMRGNPTLPPPDFTQPNDMALPAGAPPPTFRY